MILSSVSFFEGVRFAAVLAVAGGVFFWSAVIVTRGLVRRVRGKIAPHRGAVGRWARRIVLALAAAGIVALSYAYFIEPYWLEHTHVSLDSAKLPAGARPIRIVHISDLHCDPKVRLEEELPDEVAGHDPDVIVFTGDAINSRGGVGHFRRCMKRLAAIAPTFAVLGNWDRAHSNAKELYEGTGVRVLDGEAQRLEVRGVTIYFIGGPTRAWGDVARAAEAVGTDAYRVVLYHYPRRIYEAADLGVDLYLTGHTHGGQVALPFYGAVVTLAHFGKRFESGLYRVKDTWMYVNRGIGMEGGAPRIRFLARPEITRIEISPQERAAP